MVSKHIANAIEIVSSFLDHRYPVDIESICEELGIKVKDNHPLDKDGYLICKDGKKIILVNSQITNRHRKRFVIAHELGHFLLHRSQLYSCDNVSEAANQNVNNLEQEKEANVFATELLLPSQELSKHIPINPITFADIFSIAKTFDVSATHAAMQAVLLSNAESEVLICYERQKRKWYMSANRYTYPRMVPLQSPVHLASSAFETDITGVWTDLYHGSVHQEVFCPYGEQYLVLLSGNHR